MVGTTDTDGVWRAFQAANMSLFVVAVVVFAPVLLFADVLSIRFLLARTGLDVPFTAPGLDPLPAVDAYSTATVFTLLTARMLIGVLCLPAATRFLRSSEHRSFDC